MSQPGSEDRYDADRSSVATGRRKRGGLLPLLLAALLVLVLAVLIPVLACGGGDDGGGTEDSAERGVAARLESEGQSLLKAGAGRIRSHRGRPATGRGVEVLTVSKGGFFVGTGVEYSDRIGEKDEVKLPKAGDRVDLDAEVRPAPRDPGRTLLLGPTEAKTVKQRGAFLNADTVRPAG